MGRKKLGTVRLTVYLLPDQLRVLEALASANPISAGCRSEALRILLDKVAANAP